MIRAFVAAPQWARAWPQGLWNNLTNLRAGLITLLFLAAPAEAAVWYVNDTSTVGDSFTFAVGADTQPGTAVAPKRTLNSLEGFLTAGDTIYLDAGFYYEPDTFTIDTNGIFVIGKDSNATEINFGDSSIGSVYQIHAENVTNLTIQDIRVTNGKHGIYWDNVDFSTIQRVHLVQNGQYGILVQSFFGGSTDNVIQENLFERNPTGGLLIGGASSTGNLVVRNVARRNGTGFSLSVLRSSTWRGNIAENNTTDGFKLATSARDNHLEGNISRNNGGDGVDVASSFNNLFTQNTFDSNAGWAVNINGATSATDTFLKNVFLTTGSNPDSVVLNTSPSSFDFRRNWWGTTDSASIRGKLSPATQDSITYIPFRLGIVDTAQSADTVAPRAPDTVTAIAVGDTAIRVDWAASAGSEEPEGAAGQSGYILYRSTTATPTLWTAVDTIPFGQILRTDSGLVPGAAYFYRITVFDAASPFRNESFFSDSIPSATTTIDTSGPNIWYVNDGSTVGDSFTTAVGSDTNDGLTPATPKRTLHLIGALLTTGDTVRIDAGTYSDSVFDPAVGASYALNITADTVMVEGVDSASTIIDPNETSVGADVTGIWIDTQVGIRVQNLRITRAYTGIKTFFTDNSRFDSLTVSLHGDKGISLKDESDTNTINRSFFTGNGGYGVFSEVACHFNFYTDNVATSNTAGGFFLSSNRNKLTGNSANSNTPDGFDLQGSNNVLIANFARQNTQEGFTFSGSSNYLESNLAATNGDIGFEFVSANLNLLRGNTSRSNLGHGFSFNNSNNNNSLQSTADSNAKYGFFITGTSAADTFHKSVFVRSTNVASQDSGVHSTAVQSFSFVRSWWGTSDSAQIDSFMSGAGRDSVVYTPFRLGIVDTAPGADTVAPRAPDTVAAVALGQNSIRVSWAAVTMNEEPSPNPVNLAGYRVYRSPTADTSLWVQLAQTAAAADSYTDTTVSAFQTYFYRVTAFDDLAFAAFENQSFYSDSIPSATTTIDTSGPNIWYVNDTSLVGDSFTQAVGSDTANTGLSVLSPYRTLNALEGKLTPGDTIYLDAGFYYENDTFTIGASGIFLIGKDSAATVIRFDQTASDAARAISAANGNSLTLRDFRVTNGLYGIWFVDVDSSTIERVLSDANGSAGFRLDTGVASGSDGNTLSRNTSSGNLSSGFELNSASNNMLTFNASSGNNTGIGISSASNNTLTSNVTSGNSAYGISLLFASNNTLISNKSLGNSSTGIDLSFSTNNTLISNTIAGNLGPGIYFGSSSNNTLTQNTIDSNADWGIRSNPQGNTVFKNVIRTSPYASWIDSGVSGVIALTRNFWRRGDVAITDSQSIDSMIHGVGDSAIYTPFLLQIFDTAPNADTVAPRAPDTVAAVALGSSSIRVSWAAVTLNEEPSPNPVNVAGYRVYRSPTSDTSFWAQLAQTGAAADSYTDTTVTAFQTYFYRVTAFDDLAFAAYENQSFYSDSIASATTTIDTSGPNIWYVNDTSTVGDSFTQAAGSDTNTGLSVTSPYRTLNALEGKLTAGDTVYIDAGTYLEPDTFLLTVSGLFLIGKDSVASVIDFGDQTAGSARSIHGQNITNTMIRDLGVTNGFQGIFLENADSTTVRRVRTSSHGNAGINVSAGSDNILIEENLVENVGGNGFFLNGTVMTIRRNTARSNTVNGINVSANNVTFEENVATGNTQVGMRFDGATSSRITGNRSELNGIYGIWINAGSNSSVLARNFVRNNGSEGLRIENSSGNILTQNHSDSNGNYEIHVLGTSSNLTVSKNNFLASPLRPDSGVRNASAATLDFSLNWWVTADSQAIRNLMHGPNADSVVFVPFRLGIVDTAPNADTVAPRAPDTVAAASLPNSTIRVSWAAVTLNEEPSPNPVNLAGYRVHRSPTEDSSFWPVLGQAASTADSFTDTTVTAGQTWFYRVTAFDATAPFENQSFLSDSRGTATSSFDTSGPNIWYVNDAVYNASDSFTLAPGDTANSGLSPSSPKLSLAQIEPHLTQGDTVYIDAGTFITFDTFTIDTSAVAVIGVDSALTVIQFDQNGGGAARAIYAETQAFLSIRNLRVTNAYRGIYLYDCANPSLSGLRVDGSGDIGIRILFCDDAVVENVTSENNTWSGIYLEGYRNLIRRSTIRNNGQDGIELHGAQDGHLLDNRIEGNGGNGLWLNTDFTGNIGSAENRIEGNLVLNNALGGLLLYARSTSNLFLRNQFDSNAGYQIRFDADVTITSDTFHMNLILGSPSNPDSGIQNLSGNIHTVTRNWFGSADSAIVGLRAGVNVLHTPFRLGIVDTSASADTVAPNAPDTVAAVATSETAIRVSWAISTGSEEPEIAAGLAGYTVYRDTNPAASLWTAIATAPAGVEFHIDSGLVSGQVYYYRVTARDGAAFVNESFLSDSTPGVAPTAVDSTPPTVFSLTFPGDGTETNVVTITFRWANSFDSSGPVTYRLQVDTAGTFASLLADSATGIDTVGVLTLPANDTYFWRVVASDTSLNTRVSNSSFTLVIDTTGPAAFNLSSPPAGTETSATTITFSWNASSDALSGLAAYAFQLSTDSAFATFMYDSGVGLALNTTVVLPGNAAYYWAVVAIDTAQNVTIGTSPSAFYVDLLGPTAPTIVSPLGGSLNPAPITFDWNASADSLTSVAGYRLQVDTSGGFSGPLAIDTVHYGAPDTTQNLAPMTYYWRVLAIDDVGNTSAASSTESFIAASGTAPDSPSGVSATAGDQQVALAWFINSETDVIGYRVYRAPAPAGPYARINASLVAYASPTYTDTTALNGTTYYFVILAEDSSGFLSDSSRIVSATPAGETPAAPTGLAASPGNGFVLLSWNANTEPDLGGYRLYRSQTSGGPYALRLTLGKVTNISDTTVTNDTSYYYVLTAYDTEGFESPYLGQVFATPTSVDTQSPTVTHTAVTSATVNNAVPIVAIVTDNSGVNLVTLRWKRSGETVWQSAALTFSPPDSYTGVIPADSVTISGADYYITAVDATSNAGQSGSETNPHHIFVTAPDTVAPIIGHSAATQVTIATTVTITATLNDSSGILSATLAYRVTGTTNFATTPMALVIDSMYRATIPPESVTVAGIDYRIDAVDLASNPASAGVFSVPAVAADSEPPLVTHSPYTTASVGAALTVTAEITDNIRVDTVVVFYAQLYGAYDSITMTPTSGNFYGGTIPDTAMSISDTIYRYYIRATDTAGNVAYKPDTTGYSVLTTSSDTNPPQITHAPVTFAAPGETIGLLAIVTDDSAGVARVMLHFRRVGDAFYDSRTMTLSAGVYSESIPADSVTTTGVQYAIAAFDSAGNGPSWAGGLDTGSPFLIVVTAGDSTPPTISHGRIDTAVAGIALAVTATIADNVAVSNATLYTIRANDPAFTSFSMTAAGATYTATVPASIVQFDTFAYYIEASDAAGNLARYASSALPQIVTVVAPDTTAPVVAHTPITKTFVGNALNVSARASDSIGIATVAFHYRYSGGASYTALALTLDSNATYIGSLAPTLIFKNVNIEYYVRATDLSGNSAGVGAETEPFTIHVLEIMKDLSEARTFPNPWMMMEPGNEQVTINRLPADEKMSIDIYDRGGGWVDKLEIGREIQFSPSGNTAKWDGRTTTGRPIAPGVYFMRIVSGSGTRIIRLTVIR